MLDDGKNRQKKNEINYLYTVKLILTYTECSNIDFLSFSFVAQKILTLFLLPLCIAHVVRLKDTSFPFLCYFYSTLT